MRADTLGIGRAVRLQALASDDLETASSLAGLTLSPYPSGPLRCGLLPGTAAAPGAGNSGAT